MIIKKSATQICAALFLYYRKHLLFENVVVDNLFSLTLTVGVGVHLRLTFMPVKMTPAWLWFGASSMLLAAFWKDSFAFFMTCSFSSLKMKVPIP